MKRELLNYDIFPKVFPIDREVILTVKPQGKHAAFSGEYTVSVQRLDSGRSCHAFWAWNYEEQTVTPDGEGCLRFSVTARSEGERFVRIRRAGSEDVIVQLSIYALEEDLACRLPFYGDLHMHTNRSDGRQCPATVCAYYRKRGYDFIVITDHGRYYPSLEAISAYAGVHSALNILPGEEVHLPHTDIHIVNAGGTYSVNGLVDTTPSYTEPKGDPDARRMSSDVILPPTRTIEEYTAEIDAIQQSLTDLPADVHPTWYAVALWAFARIREAGGLGIFPHPFWIRDMWHVPEATTRYLMKTHPFDAFEVLGGENYYEQNGFQTALYYDEYREGRVHPIVGSTDSHDCTEHNRNAAICATIVFAEENTREAIIDAVKARYSVAVDTISAEYRLVGEYRLQKYAAFLMENFTPIHDRAAALDGELMRLYALGEAEAEEVSSMAARSTALFDKYFLRP